MKVLSRLFYLPVIVALLFLGSCKPKDADIEKNVVTAVGAYPGVQVNVIDGVATLTGEVADEAAKTGAVSAAKGVKNVKSVNDNLTIATPPPPPVEINPDVTLQQTANTTIQNLSLTTVQATAKEGVITLTGTIKRAELRGLMEKLNELKPKKIENQLTIK